MNKYLIKYLIEIKKIIPDYTIQDVAERFANYEILAYIAGQMQVDITSISLHNALTAHNMALAEILVSRGITASPEFYTHVMLFDDPSVTTFLLDAFPSTLEAAAIQAIHCGAIKSLDYMINQVHFHPTEEHLDILIQKNKQATLQLLNRAIESARLESSPSI